jgi:hypothetical protein
VLPPAKYAEEHLPHAVNIPLKTLSAGSAGQFDRAKPVLVYCFRQPLRHEPTSRVPVREPGVFQASRLLSMASARLPRQPTAAT